MALMTKMSNKDLINHFIEANTRPGETVHKFTTRGSLSKHNLEMLEKNKVMKHALSDIHGYTYHHKVKEATKDMMKEGYLHHAKNKYGTASNFVDHIFTQEIHEHTATRQQNIKDIQAQRIEIEKRRQNIVDIQAQRDAEAGGEATNHNASSSPAMALPNLAKTHVLLHQDDAESLSGTGASLARGGVAAYGVAETNLKPLDQLPKAVTRPAEWLKQDQEIEEPAID